MQKIRKPDHQITSRHRQPKDLHRQRVSRKTPVANFRIRNTNRVHTQCVKTQRASHSCHWTPAVNKELITSAVKSHVIPKITGNLQRAYFNPEKFSHLLKDIPLPDSVPLTKENANIELLLGNDYYCEIFSGEISMKAVSPGLNLIESKLWRILPGKVKCHDDKPDSFISMLTHTSSPILYISVLSQMTSNN